MEVSKDIYLAYSQMDRHSRYTEDEKSVNRELSLEQMAEDEILPGYAGLETVPDVAEMFLDADRIKMRREQSDRIRDALSSLSDADQKLLYALFVQNISVRQYARTLGVSETAIRKRRDRAIKICKRFVNKQGK